MDLIPLRPRGPVPDLRLPLAGGGLFDLAQESPRLFSMITFYRGLHCQQCRTYLRELEKLLSEFESRGVASLAVSCDGAERAERAKIEWGLDRLRLGYDLSLKDARSWGLFLTRGRPRAQGLSEPDYCCEPGVFLVARDKTLWFSAVQNMAFARPRFEDVIAGLDFLFERGYFTQKDCPARGEIASLAEIEEATARR